MPLRGYSGVSRVLATYPFEASLARCDWLKPGRSMQPKRCRYNAAGVSPSRLRGVVGSARSAIVPSPLRHIRYEFGGTITHRRLLNRKASRAMPDTVAGP